MVPFQLLFHGGVKKNQWESYPNCRLGVVLLQHEECCCTMHNSTCIVMMQFPFSDEVWSLFGYVILHELLQDCNVILCIDGSFY